MLGIQGVFASTSLKAGEDWRWQTHTMNVPVYYEYKDDDVTDKEKLELHILMSIKISSICI